MALIYRSESTKRRQKNKKPKPPPKKPKFPKLPQKGKGKEPAERPKISDPFDPILGTAHANNRLNGFFGVNPEDLLPRDESMPHLNQWISEALASIAYKCSKAHHLTKKICFPQAGWKRFKQRLGLTEDDVLTHVLRNIANMFKHLRDYYMDARAPPVVECLEESDLLWQNILEPITGVVQIMSEVLFRGHTNLEIHKIDGLKLARSLRICGEELNHTAKMLDHMIGGTATKWTDRTVLMAIETAQRWRVETIKSMGLEGLYHERDDDDEEDVKNIDRAKFLAKLNIPALPGEGESSRKESTPTGKAKKSSPAVQAKDKAQASSSRTKGPILKKAPSMPRTRGVSVLLQRPQVLDPMEEAYNARKKLYEEREQQEYTDRCNERTRLENLDSDDDKLPTTQPTGHSRVFAAANPGQPHHGLQMDNQAMELDPLRMAQIQGVGNAGNMPTYPSYRAFPSAHLTVEKTNTETVSRGSGLPGKEDKGKGTERRSALKKENTETPESSRKTDKLIPPQSGFAKDGVKHTDQARRMKSSDHIVTQVKGYATTDREDRVEILAPPSRNVVKKPSTSALANSKEGPATPVVSPQEEQPRVDSIRRPKVRFTEESIQAEQAKSARKSEESSTARKIRELNSSSSRRAKEASSRRNSGESTRTHSGRRSTTNRSSRHATSSRNDVEPSTNNNGLPFPIPLRVGGNLMPPPPKIRHTRSKSPLDNHGVGFPKAPTPIDDELMPAPLKLRQTRSQSALKNSGVASAGGPTPMKFEDALAMAHKISDAYFKSPVNNGDLGSFTGRSQIKTDMTSAPLKIGHRRIKSPLDNRGVGSAKAPSQTGSQSALPDRGVGLTASRSRLSITSFAEYESSPIGPPPDRPLPPLPTNRK